MGDEEPGRIEVVQEEQPHSPSFEELYRLELPNMPSGHEEWDDRVKQEKLKAEVISKYIQELEKRVHAITRIDYIAGELNRLQKQYIDLPEYSNIPDEYIVEARRNFFDRFLGSEEEQVRLLEQSVLAEVNGFVAATNNSYPRHDDRTHIKDRLTRNLDYYAHVADQTYLKEHHKYRMQGEVDLSPVVASRAQRISELAQKYFKSADPLFSDLPPLKSLRSFTTFDAFEKAVVSQYLFDRQEDDRLPVLTGSYNSAKTALATGYDGRNLPSLGEVLQQLQSSDIEIRKKGRDLLLRFTVCMRYERDSFVTKVEKVLFQGFMESNRRRDRQDDDYIDDALKAARDLSQQIMQSFRDKRLPEGSTVVIRLANIEDGLANLSVITFPSEKSTEQTKRQ